MSDMHDLLSKNNIHSPIMYLKTFAKWMAFSLLMGIVCGLAGTLFHHTVDYVTEMRTLYHVLLLPFAGLFIVFLYHICGMEHDRGTNTVLEAVQTRSHVPARMAPLIFVATSLSHAFGGSVGREGAALQNGASIGNMLGGISNLDDTDKRIITMCGMSALFSALFGTPVAAAIFSMEVASVGVIYYGAMIPGMIAAIISYYVADLFGVVPVHFLLEHTPNNSIITTFQTVLAAILFSLVGILFCITMQQIGKLYRRYFKNPYVRIFVGGCIIAALTLLIGSQDYNGAGMSIITKAIQGNAKPEAFFIKLLFTALTLGAGFKGGEIIPAFFVGSTFGAAVGPLLGLDPGFCAALGLLGVFCSVVNTPLATMFLGIELFGTDGLLYFGIVCAITHMLSGNFSLYSSQQILYNKSKPVYGKVFKP